MVVTGEVENLAGYDQNNTTDLIKVVVFSFGGRKYGLEILELQEIIKIPKIAPLPGTAAYIRGVTSLRGKVVVVFDLDKKFHLTNGQSIEYSRLVLVKIGGELFGILTENNVEIIEVGRGMVKNASSLLDLSNQRDCFKGIIATDYGRSSNYLVPEKDANINKDNIIILLDMVKIISEQEMPKV